MKNQITSHFNLDDSKIQAIFPYGSHVYQTNHVKSDYDFIVVCDVGYHNNEFAIENNNINIHFYDIPTFISLLDKHKIFALECHYLPTQLILKNNLKYHFQLNLAKLRHSVSEKVSHSWVKAKKKFEVEQDRNVYIGKKSLFHSLRIIDFGIQLAQHNAINYASCKNLWEEIYSNPSEMWQDYENKYKPYFNHQMTEFRKLAPK